MSTHDDMDRGGHPTDEALAGLADWSLPPEEEARVRAHVDACARCREDVAFAAAGAAALASLPSLESPGLAPPEPAAAPERSAVRPSARRREGRHLGWSRAIWGASGVAVAAGLVALAVVMSGGGAGKTSSTAGIAAATSPSARRAPELALVSGKNYEANDLDALAAALAASRGKLPLAAAPSAPAGAGEQTHDAALRNASCVTRAAGSPNGDIVWLESARYQGHPAIIAGFLTSGPGQPVTVTVVAADPHACTAFHVSRATAAPTTSP